ncbi:MAG: DinB family protein [Acidobacteriia bacterium]|nr:DinB family protein [Terriglobia bacterium]
MLNPYASYLGNANPVEVIGSTPGRLAGLAQKLGKERVGKSPAPGKWSPREIFCHLADCEIVFAYRLRQTLAEPNHVIQPFDQELWAKNYAAYDADSALALFSAARRWNLAMINSVPKADHAKTVTHPERGTMTFATIFETIAGHDINHLQQLEKIAAS